ncbi:MAG: tRNA epoxyqueuosine(34) reductase QueG [Gammaproteobacteria bacterium]
MISLTFSPHELQQLAADIKVWGRELGFQQVGITDTNLTDAEQKLNEWLARGYHGEMEYMSKHGDKRSRPELLIPGTIRVISVRMDYLPPNIQFKSILKNPFKAFISRYALGKDYHKLIRKRLEKLAQKIQEYIGTIHYRVFCDSAPVLEKPLAEKAGLGWIGKHTNLINAKAGSWFFLGTIYTNIPLPVDVVMQTHCGSCSACMTVCPTNAIVGPYQLDATRCISYLTIELEGSIPVEFRKAIGNRIYGCDDCQLVCPWNKFAKYTTETGFFPRNNLQDIDLLTLFQWSENEYHTYTEGSAIRRIGYERWLRNIAVALGNAPRSDSILHALRAKLVGLSSEMLQEHIIWAINEQAR